MNLKSFNNAGLISKALKSVRTDGLQPTFLKIVRYPFKHVANRRNRNQIFRHDAIEDRFTEIYKMNYWGSEESFSGNGSTLSFTENLRKNLPDLFRKFSITSIFDAPCGDFNWMQHVLKETPLSYIGGDIVLPLIASHNERYKNPSTQFIHIDITKGKLPLVDMMICRDCLFHLSLEDTRAALKNFVSSGIQYLLTTTHVNTDNFVNNDIKTGDFRRIDLLNAPYNFPKDVLFRISDWQAPEPEKEMCLWSREQVITALENCTGYDAL